MDNQVDISKAAQILGLSDRSIYRLLSKVRLRGVKAIVHGNRDNTHASKISERYKQKIIDLATEKYGSLIKYVGRLLILIIKYKVKIDNYNYECKGCS